MWDLDEGGAAPVVDTKGGEKILDMAFGPSSYALYAPSVKNVNFVDVSDPGARITCSNPDGVKFSVITVDGEGLGYAGGMDGAIYVYQ